MEELGLEMALQLLLCMQTITPINAVSHVRSVLTSATAKMHYVMAVP